MGEDEKGCMSEALVLSQPTSRYAQGTMEHHGAHGR